MLFYVEYWIYFTRETGFFSYYQLFFALGQNIKNPVPLVKYEINTIFNIKPLIILFLHRFVFVFVVLRLTRKFFHSYRDVNITGKRLQILPYTRRSWPLSSKDSLACHSYFDKGHMFIHGEKIFSASRLI